jgi:hypothetical protein
MWRAPFVLRSLCNGERYGLFATEAKKTSKAPRGPGRSRKANFSRSAVYPNALMRPNIPAR